MLATKHDLADFAHSSQLVLNLLVNNAILVIVFLMDDADSKKKQYSYRELLYFNLNIKWINALLRAL